MGRQIDTGVPGALDFRVLGPIEVRDGSRRRLGIEGRRTRALLALLLIRRNRAVEYDTVIGSLWNDDPPSHAKATLHAYVSKLRRALEVPGSLPGGERLLRRAPGYQLVTLEGEVDAERLEQALALGEMSLRQGRLAAASAVLHQGLQLVRGPMFGECRDEPFAQIEVARLEAVRLRALEHRIDADLGLGRHGALVGELQGLTAEYGLHERFHEQLMLAFYRCGRQADALQAYQDARRLLAEELGLLPGHGLRNLESAVLAHDPTLDQGTPPSLRVNASIPAAPGNAPFVGRHRERQFLESAWRHASRGRRQLVVIEAEPGMGATRLATEIASDAGNEGAVVLMGRAAGDAVIPYLPFVEALGPCVAGMSPEDLQLCAGQGAPFLAQLLPGSTPLPPPNGLGAPASSHRYLLFEAVAALVSAAATCTGAVLVLDDIHEADPSTIQLLDHLARHNSPARLLIVATSDRSSAGSPLLSQLVADGLAARLALDGLSVDEVGELLGALVDPAAGEPAMSAHEMHELTSGIPLFVEELGKSLPEAEQAKRQGTACDLPVSERVRATLDRRLDHIPAPILAALSAAAVIGTVFDAEVLRLLGGQTDAVLAGYLDVAVAEGLVHADAIEDRYRFAHRLLHRAFDQRIGPSTRRRLHGQLARILTGPEAPAAASPGEIALHFKRAVLYHAHEAVTYAVRAGDHAMGVLAFEDAADLYRSALDTLESFGGEDPRLEGQILLALGKAHHASYRRADAVATFGQAIELAITIGDRVVLAASTWGLIRSTEFSCANAGMAGLLRRALDTYGEAGGPLTACLTVGLARALPADDPEAGTLASDAIDAVRRIRQPETRATVLSTAVLVTWSPDNRAWRHHATAEVISLAAELGWVELAMEARNWRAAAHEEDGNLAAADEDLAAMESWATGSRRPFFVGLVAMRKAARALLCGRYEEVEHEGHRLLAAAGDSPDFVAGYGAQLLLMRRDQGRLGELDLLVRQQVSASPGVAAWRVALALVDLGLGRRRQARDELERLAADELAALPKDWLWLGATTLLAEVCADLEHVATAPTLLRALGSFESQVAVLGHGVATLGAVSGPIGRLEAQLGHWAAAERHFRHAVSLNTEIGAFPALVRTKVAYAEMLALRADQRDAGCAAELLRSAEIIATRLGMVGFHKKTARSSTDAEGANPRLRVGTPSPKRGLTSCAT